MCTPCAKFRAVKIHHRQLEVERMNGVAVTNQSEGSQSICSTAKHDAARSEQGP